MDQHRLSKAIAYAAGLTHELYSKCSMSKWYYMLFRVVELLYRVSPFVRDEADQMVVLTCFQVKGGDASAISRFSFVL